MSSMVSEADQWKEKGNTALKAGNIEEAISLYTKAIDLDPSSHVYYSNRSAAHLSNDDAEKALADAESCIKANDSWAKGFMRKGAALHKLKRYREAAEAYVEGLKVAPGNAALARGLDDVMREQQEASKDRKPMRDIPEEEKTPVTIVTGFLGAGKTTLVNYILREQRDLKIAVIENEFGAVSIDTDLVEENVREVEDIITMDNGCVCCTVRGDLVKALGNFADRRHTFDCIMLETTGIADPSPIAQTFNQEMNVRFNYRIDSVLTLVDAKNILMQLKRVPEEGAVNEAVQQLAFADSVIINKTDLVSAEELQLVKDKVHSINAHAKVVTAEKSRVPLKSVLNQKSYNLERTLELLEQTPVHDDDSSDDDDDHEKEVKKNKQLLSISSTMHDSKVGSLAVTLKGSLDAVRFNNFMGEFIMENRTNIYRSKGVLAFKSQEKKIVFQGVHEQISCELSTIAWAKDGSDRESKLVFIGLDLDNDYITQKLEECLVPAEAATA